ncbi:hypothetical protein THA_1301 [Thermosipho africanus TCF52B]|uniref:DUF5320 domain-containing protein n=1 Tax=Thermosipho africanus (strain TCF52B) TaxID=484019 RepID=B7ICL9_THEAB|nr:DUF5320 family protein [Thermosipho africanus]ACJ75746.1 hypothetical protein THA_1301 [Thermosipho africanus TCF52B]
MPFYGGGYGGGYGRGFGIGYGRGFGRGFGYGAGYGYYGPSIEEERAMLMRYLEEELRFVEERLRELDNYQGGDR